MKKINNYLKSLFKDEEPYFTLKKYKELTNSINYHDNFKFLMREIENNKENEMIILTSVLTYCEIRINHLKLLGDENKHFFNDTKADLLFNIIKHYPNTIYADKAEELLLADNNPKVSMQVIEKGYAKNVVEHANVILNNNDRDNIRYLLELSQFVQQNKIDEVSWEEAEKKSIQLYYHHYNKKWFTDYDYMFKYLKGSVEGEWDSKVQKELASIVMNHSTGSEIAYLLDHNLVDINDYPRKFENYYSLQYLLPKVNSLKPETISKILEKPNKEFEDVGCKSKIIKALDAEKFEDLDIQKIVDMYVDSYDLRIDVDAVIKLANLPEVDVAKLEDFVCKNGNFKDISKFAENVDNEDVKKHFEEASKQHEEEEKKKQRGDESSEVDLSVHGCDIASYRASAYKHDRDMYGGTFIDRSDEEVVRAIRMKKLQQSGVGYWDAVEECEKQEQKDRERHEAIENDYWSRYY